MRIAICDDEKESIYITKRYTEEFFKDNNIKCEIKQFTTAEKLLAEKDNFNLYLLDIEMGNINGIQVGEILRSRGDMTPIVYITNYVDYWRRAYLVHAFEFLEKPLDRDCIYRVLNDFLELIYKVEEPRLIVKIDGKETIIDHKEIIYIMVNDKGIIDICCLHCTYKVKNVMLNSLIEQLNSTKFFMCHRSCIVNIDYVEHIENDYDIVMKNGEFCPLAQKKRKEFLKFIFSAYNRELRR